MNARRRVLCALFLGALFLAGSPLQAAAGEKERLLHLAEELDFLLQSAERAEAAAPSGGETLFDYASLRADLRLIRRAILDHASAPSRRPRRLQSLRANYGGGR